MKFFFLSILLLPFSLQAQRWHLNLTGGVSNYSGDLQGKSFTMDESNFAFGGGLQYDITPHFSLLTNLSLMKVTASDALNNPDLVFRNLSFQSGIVEWNLLAEYNFIDLTEHRFSPFVFGGIAVFHFNPFAVDSTGNKVYLKPLSTEGEGLAEFPDQKPYSLTQFSIPFGGGIKMRLSENVVLAYEIGFRKTNTDYLDDVSTIYVDPNILAAAKGDLSVQMAYRADELKGGNPVYPTGKVRGGVKYKDWYYYTGLRVSISLGAGRNNYFNRGRTDCPGSVQ